MLNNRPQAWNHWGVSAAEVLVEALCEGKTTGLMAVYNGYEALPDRVFPVGDGRDTFWQLAMPYNAVPVQLDSNIYASNLLNYYSYQPIEAVSAGKDAFVFADERAALGHEFAWYITQERYENAMNWYGMSRNSAVAVPDLFRFAGSGEALPAPTGESGSADRLKVTFSDQYAIRLPYNAETGLYEKYQANNEPHVDAFSGQVVSFRNVFVLECVSGVKDDGYTREYDLSAGGEGLYLTDGTWQKIRWEKGSPMDPLKLYNAAGEELTVNRGASYIALYGGFTGQQVQVRSGETDLYPFEG